MSLSISTDSEDLEYLNVVWKDEYDEHVSPDDGKRQLHIFSTEHRDAAEYIKSRPLTRSRASSATLEKCLERYKSCLNHEMCKKALRSNKRNTAPTRLLEIRPNSELHLYTVPQGENPLYAALTYCWGNSQQQQNAKTTSENVKNRHGRIDKCQLPQTIIDAVKIARTLELSYLWVDVFCISKMKSIYRGATITISAASARDSTEGFLRDRDLKKAYGNLFKLPYYNKRAGHVVKGWLLLSEHPIADTYEENIDKRAWTMEEDILSLRLLRFGSKQTTWRCATYPQAETIDGGGCPTLKNKDYAFSVNSPHRNSEVRSNVLRIGPSGGESCVEADWFHVISEYTLRSSKKPKDRLPACAALAESFANIMGFKSSDYLAGLWKNNIHSHLLWYRLEGRKAAWISEPSWSWACISGPIYFLGFELSEPTSGANIAKYVSSSMEYKFRNYKYGEVVSGCLKLNGRLREVHWNYQCLRRSADDPDVLPLEIYWDLSDGDSLDGPSWEKPVYCFEIFGTCNYSLGLLLVRNDKSGFRRAGCYEDTRERGPSTMSSLFDETEPQNIEIH
ncbi:hypothetical protein COCVIDRAFT_32510 [Bipolaris victoriae FI3]|uniref:Heterokaryon incompatibility domain-containing protein n=1 Tax=Bipolaris victoriae (strain FI3) TaxID=930091 RepID=W7ERJ9_BIPV3|nr:hypothetical protein COCVIDRAFT_32510 [Bipolaris victoriae FI3]